MKQSGAPANETSVQHPGERIISLAMDEMSLIKKIEAAFAHRQMPAEVVNMEGRYQIDSDVDDALWFQGRDWRGLTRDDWEKRHWGVIFLSPHAFAYYLPSLLILAIQDSQHYPDLAIQSFMMILDRSPGKANWDPPLTDRFFGWSTEEYEAMKDWLLFACENIPGMFYGAAASGPGDGFGRAFETIDSLQKETELQRMIDEGSSDTDSK